MASVLSFRSVDSRPASCVFPLKDALWQGVWTEPVKLHQTLFSGSSALLPMGKQSQETIVRVYFYTSSYYCSNKPGLCVFIMAELYEPLRTRGTMTSCSHPMRRNALQMSVSSFWKSQKYQVLTSPAMGTSTPGPWWGRGCCQRLSQLPFSHLHRGGVSAISQTAFLASEHCCAEAFLHEGWILLDQRITKRPNYLICYAGWWESALRYWGVKRRVVQQDTTGFWVASRGCCCVRSSSVWAFCVWIYLSASQEEGCAGP